MATHQNTSHSFEDILGSQVWERLQHTKSAPTILAYRREWETFASWCRRKRVLCLPAAPETVCDYLKQHSQTLSLSTLYRQLAAIGCAHSLAGFPSPSHSPEVKKTLQDIRLLCTQARVHKALLGPHELQRILPLLPENLQGTRDRCLLLLASAAELHRSELVALDREDIVKQEQGLLVTIQNDGLQPKAARAIFVPSRDNTLLCPVIAYQNWISQAEIEDGPVFRWVTRHGQVRAERLSDKSVSLVVKRAVQKIGRNPDQYAARSLRPRQAV